VGGDATRWRDLGEGAVASLTGYAIGAEPEPVGGDMPALFRPLQELENQALESWYVNVLACYPDYRGQGYGSLLLRAAEDIARDAGQRRMSVIVSDTNRGARRLRAARLPGGCDAALRRR
jgi:ribosomal protein S18 acetylase RimI-like enzyme